MLIDSPQTAHALFHQIKPAPLTWEWVSGSPSRYDPIPKRMIQFQLGDRKTRYWVRSHPQFFPLLINPTQFVGVACKQTARWLSRHQFSRPMTETERLEVSLIRLHLEVYRSLNHSFVPFHLDLQMQKHYSPI